MENNEAPWLGWQPKVQLVRDDGGEITESEYA
jgi:hypothetical protein